MTSSVRGIKFYYVFFLISFDIKLHGKLKLSVLTVQASGHINFISKGKLLKQFLKLYVDTEYAFEEYLVCVFHAQKNTAIAI